MNKKKKVAIIGTNGVPNQYGGFETLVDYLAEYLHDRFDITIYCSRTQKTRIKEYKGCCLKYLPLSANGWQGILYDALSVAITAPKYDEVLILGCSSIFTIRLFSSYKKKYILNIGGIDWRRSKWGKVASWFIHESEKACVPICPRIISDNEGIREYIKETYNKDSYLIEYGGDQVTKQPITSESKEKYSFLNSDYALVVARIQSDNNIEMSIKGCLKAQYPLVVVGNWNSSDYGQALRQKYGSEKGLYLLDAIYNQDELNILRSNASIYIHGHSGGGTNPSLVEIMNLEVPVICFGSNYNRYTTENKSLYYNNADELTDLIMQITPKEKDDLTKALKEVADRRYKWKIIADKYAQVIEQ